MQPNYHNPVLLDKNQRLQAYTNSIIVMLVGCRARLWKKKGKRCKFQKLILILQFEFYWRYKDNLSILENLIDQEKTETNNLR
jgi:hypothetical protein